MTIGHTKQWKFLKNKFEAGQLSHAYLFSGESQVGKRTFAKELVKLINCSNKAKGKNPCQQCINCQMIEKGAFPDLMQISSENGQEIAISKIRETQNYLSYKSYYGSFKSVIIDDADRMNIEAQSCFLKTLEEPKGKTLLILVSSRPDVLLQTILSRCQQVKFFPVKSVEIKGFLLSKGVKEKTAQALSAISEGKPGKAQQLAEDPDRLEKEKAMLDELLAVAQAELSEKFKYAKSIDFEKTKLSVILELLERHFRKLLLLKAKAGQEEHSLKEKDVFKNYPISRLKRNIDLIEDLNYRTLFTNASPKLALEILLMEI